MNRPNKITYHKASKTLEVGYANGTNYQLPAEYLRVWSPSAEVRGHGGGEPVTVPGKLNVAIDQIEPVGNYAVRLRFDDGHRTGLYSWDVLQDLGENQDERWQDYLQRLETQGLKREPDTGVKKYSLREARLKGES